jgi:hypothetical protein
MRILIILALLLFTSFTNLAGQEVRPLTPGARLRVTVPGVERMVGTVALVKPDTLVLLLERGSTPTAIPLTSIRAVEVSRGERGGAWAGAKPGASIGGALFGVASLLVVPATGTDPDEALGDIAILTFGGAVYGAAIGAVIGALTGSERWERTPLSNSRVGISPRGLTLSVSFP